MKKLLNKVAGLLFCKAASKSPLHLYERRFNKNAFVKGVYKSEQHYEAQIIKMYHSIEKGLSYKDFRAGFGRQNVEELISALESYAALYDAETSFYKTALSTLYEYVAKNEACGFFDEELKRKIEKLPGTRNEKGGTIKICHKEVNEFTSYEQFVLSRHSIREFSSLPVDLTIVNESISLAQHTPSACNRQGWKTRIVVNKDVIKTILANQNGNRGFGENIDKLLIVTSDIRYFARGREANQVFIDGGMYAMNILHALHSKNIATIPLSASLRVDQEKAVRDCIKMDEAEVLIMFIGIGNYPEETLTTKSERHEPRVEII